MSSVRLEPRGHRGSSGGDHASSAAAGDGLRRLRALALQHLRLLRGDIAEPGARQVLPVCPQVRLFVADVLVPTLICLAGGAGVHELHGVFEISADFKRPRPVSRDRMLSALWVLCRRIKTPLSLPAGKEKLGGYGDNYAMTMIKGQQLDKGVIAGFQSTEQGQRERSFTLAVASEAHTQKKSCG